MIKTIDFIQIPSGQYPVLVFGGEVSLQTQSGKLVRITLSTHEISPNVHEYTNQELKDVINKNISLGRFRNAWAICQVTYIISNDTNAIWKKQFDHNLNGL